MVYRLKKNILFSEVAKLLDNEVIGLDQELLSVAAFGNSGLGDLTFSNKFDGLTRACLITDEIPKQFPKDFAFIQSENPRLDFIRALDFVNKEIAILMYLI